MIDHLPSEYSHARPIDLPAFARPAHVDDARYRDLLAGSVHIVEQVITSVAKRHRLSIEEREELGSMARLKLVDRHYAVLRQFEGRSSFKTYLTRVVSRLALDLRTNRWGKWRPSAAARRGGRTAVLLEQLIVRDGFSFDESCEMLRTNYRLAVSARDIEAIYAALPRRCRRRVVGEEALATIPAPEVVDDEALAETSHRAALFDALARAIAALSAADRHLVRLRYTDGWTVGRIARSVGVPARTMYRAFDRIVRDLRRALVGRRGAIESSQSHRSAISRTVAANLG
jgi:RNA polymerase sigma factor (sigma-70 family)